MATVREVVSVGFVSGVPHPKLTIDSSLAALPASVTHTRASVGSYWDASWVLQSAAINTPRFTYWPGVAGGPYLLREEGATNLFLNSTTGATQSITVTAAAHTLSFLGTGTITLSGVSTAGPLTGTGANNMVSLTFTPTAGSLTCTVTGTCTDVQLETGTGATSRVVTAGAAVTRSRDVITLPSTCVTFSQSSAMIRCAPITQTGGNAWGLYLGSASETIIASYNAPAATTLRYTQNSGGAAVATGLAGTSGLLTLSTLCAAWGGGACTYGFNGGTVTVDASAASPSPGSPVYMLGGNSAAGNAGFTALIREVRLWSGVKLNDGQVQQLSAFTG